MATAFAIYSETDNSLNFYKRDTVPAVGDTFEGKAVTKIWTGFETISYTNSKHPDWQKDGTIQLVKSVAFVDAITPKSLAGWFRNGKLITSFDLAKLDTSNVTQMGYAFRDCTSIEHLDVSTFNTAKVTSMRSMFYNCYNLQELDVSNFDVAKVTDMCFTFYNLLMANIIGLDKWRPAAVTQLQSTFYKCASTPHFNLAGWDTSNVTNMSYMFYGATGTIDFTGWNTSKVTTFAETFGKGFFTYLDLSSFDVRAVTNMIAMFFDCISLKTIITSYNWNESFLEEAQTEYMFENCSMLMGDVSYKQCAEEAAEGDFYYMEGDMATSVNGYFTLASSDGEDEEEGDDGEVAENKSYMVLGSTIHDIANSIRKILGTPQKISLKNFSKILDNQINSTSDASLIWKDRLFKDDDLETSAVLTYMNTNMTLQTIDLNRYYTVPSIVKGSIIVLTNVASLTENTDAVLEGDIEKIGDGMVFILNGNASITLREKIEEDS